MRPGSLCQQVTCCCEGEGCIIALYRPCGGSAAVAAAEPQIQRFSPPLLGPESLANVDTDSDYEQIQLELRLRDARTVPRRRTLDARTVPRRRTLDARTVPRSRTLNGILALCR
jgi:hypothetical protein